MTPMIPGGWRCCQCCCPVKMCSKCCFWALDKVIKYFNRNSYIMIAIYRDNYIVSAKSAYMLWGRNMDCTQHGVIHRVVMVDRVTDLLLFFGKLLMVGAEGVCFFFGEITGEVFKSSPGGLVSSTVWTGLEHLCINVSADIFQAELLNYHWLPIIMVTVGAYFIAQGCFSICSKGVDTFSLCILDDLECNDGTLQKSYMSMGMMQILQKESGSVSV